MGAAASLADFVSVAEHSAVARGDGEAGCGGGGDARGWGHWEVWGRVLAGEWHGWLCHSTVAVGFHSVVRVRLGGGWVVCDPYHAVGPVPLVHGAVTAGASGGQRAVRRPRR